mmetsp:Transcript_53788/g.151171  ORF Transcript_53788/g.151171 Transcript_53788/m.151171 type:complete len:260 (-) Transcript_53788:598-1377(-)
MHATSAVRHAGLSKHCSVQSCRAPMQTRRRTSCRLAAATAAESGGRARYSSRKTPPPRLPQGRRSRCAAEQTAAILLDKCVFRRPADPHHGGHGAVARHPVADVLAHCSGRQRRCHLPPKSLLLVTFPVAFPAGAFSARDHGVRQDAGHGDGHASEAQEAQRLAKQQRAEQDRACPPGDVRHAERDGAAKRHQREAHDVLGVICEAHPQRGGRRCVPIQPTCSRRHPHQPLRAEAVRKEEQRRGQRRAQRRHDEEGLAA